MAVQTFLTNTMLFLERPESQLKIDAFYLTGPQAAVSRPPIVFVTFLFFIFHIPMN